jgi:polyferredoxin
MLPDATWIRPPAKAGLHKARRVVQIATSVLLLIAPFVDLLRFDVKNGALILFGRPFGLSELEVVYAILVLSFVVVFAGALLYGRIYCGWMCPQTTLSEWVAQLERLFCPKRGPRGTTCKVMTVVSSAAVSALVAASLVSYFIDPAERLHPGPIAVGSFLASFVVLFGDLYFLRHRFCVGVCPYGILQNIIQDNRTLGVQLVPERAAECTNCMLCVRACFMGVDIRTEPFDPRCLNCGDCIAATRLSKTCPDEPLIEFRYGTARSTWPSWLRALGVTDFRRVIVMVLTAGATALVISLSAGRADLELEVAGQFEKTVVAAGVARDTYQLAASNRLDQEVRLELTVAGVPGLAVAAPLEPIVLGPRERVRREVVLSAPSKGLEGGARTITMKVAPSAGKPLELETRFFVP